MCRVPSLVLDFSSGDRQNALTLKDLAPVGTPKVPQRNTQTVTQAAVDLASPGIKGPRRMVDV